MIFHRFRRKNRDFGSVFFPVLDYTVRAGFNFDGGSDRLDSRWWWWWWLFRSSRFLRWRRAEVLEINVVFLLQ